MPGNVCPSSPERLKTKMEVLFLLRLAEVDERPACMRVMADLVAGLEDLSNHRRVAHCDQTCHEEGGGDAEIAEEPKDSRHRDEWAKRLMGHQHLVTCECRISRQER